MAALHSDGARDDTHLRASRATGEPTAVITRGTGPAVVLLNGLLGGTARLEPLADQLVAEGFRVVIVDAYRLAADAPDVSFHGLADAVAITLRRERVNGAVVVAHAHAAGVALRLAGSAPALVTDLLLLDAGVLPSTRSVGVTRAMRIASIVARFPGGRSLIRARLAAGIRANSGNGAWLTEPIAREYTDPLLDELPAVAKMVARLADAREPESVEQWLPRVRAAVTVLVGGAPHAIGASEDELALVRRIPGARVRSVNGVGHFVHEEAPQAVLSAVLATRAQRGQP
ncbi:MAG: alpha/beta fold hydrolase [Gemmatimonadaceae bacterium]